MHFHIITFSIIVGLVFSHYKNQAHNFTTPEHCSLPLLRLLCYQYTLQDKISDTQASPGIAGGHKDIDWVSGSFSAFKGSWWRQDEKLLIFATSSQLCTGWISSYRGSFPSKKQGHKLHSESQSKEFKRTFPHGNSLTEADLRLARGGIEAYRMHRY